MKTRSLVNTDAKYTVSKLNFVDLAGSERLGKTNVSKCLYIILYHVAMSYGTRSLKTIKFLLFTANCNAKYLNILSDVISKQKIIKLIIFFILCLFLIKIFLNTY